MNWYYVDAGERAGPINDEDFAALARVGKMQSSTLVWHEGMSDWQPFSSVRTSISAAPTDGLPSPGLRVGTSVGLSQAICDECRKVFPTDSMIRYGNVWVCANCKPIFVQKLSEGALLDTS